MHTNNVAINRVVMYETGTYNPMFLRPYESTVQQGTLDELAYRTEGGVNLSAATLSPLAGSVIRPTAMAGAVANIVNGWDAKRLCFFIEADITTFNGTVREIISGYTDHYGFFNGHLDPNMILQFNGSMIVHSQRVRGPNGVYYNTSVRDAAHILTAPQQDVFASQASATTIRPEDVFSQMETGLYQEIAGVGTENLRLTFGAGSKKSRRSNTNTTQYLSGTLGAYKDAKLNEQFSGNEYSTIEASARGKLKEMDLGKDLFIRAVTDGDPALMRSASCTWGKLLAIRPDLESATDVVVSTPNAPQQRHTVGSTANWHGSDLHTHIATVISHAIPSMVLDMMFVGFSFIAKTLPDGSCEVSCTNFGMWGSSDNGIDPRPYIQALEQKIALELMPGLTQNGLINLLLQVDCYPMVETAIGISIEGEPRMDYTMPSFCDALTVPTLAGSSENLQVIANDFRSLTDGLNGIGTNIMYGDHPSLI